MGYDVPKRGVNVELNINEHYIILNQLLLQEMVTGGIDKVATLYYTTENDLIDNYYADINDAPGQISGMMAAMELCETLLFSQFEL